MAQITQISHRRDTAANWTTNNPTPSAGELCWETDTNKVKMGDGSTAWTSLVYLIDGLDTNIYDSNGTLAGARTMTMGGNDLTLDGTGNIVLADSGNITADGDVAVNGGDVTTTATTASLMNTNATTLNVGGAATTVSIGAGTGTTTINNAETVVTGNLTVNGTTTSVNSTTLQVDDKNIELGTVTTPTDVTADGGGITLKGATDKTIIWDNATDQWQFNQGINLTLDQSTYAAGAGTVAATDSIQEAIQKLDGNIAAAASPITTRGDIITGNASGAEQRVAIGAAGTFVKSDGTDTIFSNVIDGGSS